LGLGLAFIYFWKSNLKTPSNFNIWTLFRDATYHSK